MPSAASFCLGKMEVEKRRLVEITKGGFEGQGISPITQSGILDSYFGFLVVTETSFAALYRPELF